MKLVNECLIYPREGDMLKGFCKLICVRDVLYQKIIFPVRILSSTSTAIAVIMHNFRAICAKHP